MSTVSNTLPTHGSAECDLSPIRDILGKWLVGQPYLFSRAGYQAELTLHFGVRQAYSSPKMADRTRGSHVLSLRASAWALASGTTARIVTDGLTPVGPGGELPVGRPFPADILESGHLVTPGATVSRAQPLEIIGGPPGGGVSLWVQLTDGTTLTVFPSHGDPAETLSDWELLTPDGLLRVGPGNRFAVETGV